MQSENFDKKIKDSLSQRPPGNDIPAWDKMEPLLDKHLPQEKKDRRRVFFILFLFLLTGGGLFLILKNNNGNKNNISAIESQNKNPDQKGNSTLPDGNVKTNPTPSQKATVSEKIPAGTEVQNNSTEKKNVSSNILPQFLPGQEITITNANVKKSGKQKDIGPVTEKTSSVGKTTNIPEKDKQTLSVENATKPGIDPLSIDKKDPVKSEAEKTSIENKTEAQKPETKESQPLLTEKSNTKKHKDQRSFFDNLFFSVSAGPDRSSVGFHSPGEIRLAYGAGLGYKISDKFSIRTGFYSARKVYTADPKDYDPPYNVAQYYPNLKYVDANCKVYEIPVMIDYTISNNKKGSWFVSGGISSLIMKEEKYDYYYKPNYSPTYVTYTRTVKDQNKHYFSQLNLSGGYTRNINNNISLRAEPYIKIAMHGVGFGKVDLNSGGILFSGIIKPFAKK